MKYLVVVEGAIALHIEGMKSAGEPIPAPSSESAVVDVDAA